MGIPGCLCWEFAMQTHVIESVLNARVKDETMRGEYSEFRLITHIEISGDDILTFSGR